MLNNLESRELQFANLQINLASQGPKLDRVFRHRISGKIGLLAKREIRIHRKGLVVPEDRHFSKLLSLGDFAGVLATFNCPDSKR